MNSLQPILLIEDDEVDVMTVKRCFKELNIPNKIITAINGKEAYETLLNRNNRPNPSLILLDINMPIMSGLEFLKKLKNIEQYKHIPVVMLTSSREEEDIMRCYQLGIAGYLIKPLEYKDFVKSFAILNEYWSMSELPL